ERSDDENFAIAKSVGTLAFEPGKSYRLIDKTSVENLNGRFYYRLRRTKSIQWAWNYSKVAHIDLAMKHQYIGSATAVMSDNSHVLITWDYDEGNVLSDNSDILLKRTNEMRGTSETYAIPRDSIDVGHYTELLMTTCDVYSYMIYMKPGNSNYKQQEALKISSTEKLYTAEMGKVIALNASKGYFSDRIALEWETDGKTVDVFSIRARKYQSNDPFKQIDQLSGNIASVKYQYSDTKSIPGVIYEYQVVSIASCGDENRMIESDTEIGFRTPTGDIYGRITYENGQAVKDAEVRAEMTDGLNNVGKSYWFNGNHSLVVLNNTLLSGQEEVVTLQAWIKAEGNDGSILKKDGMFDLQIADGRVVFEAGSQTITSKVAISEFQQSS
ncbi:MAG: hypothetical protein RR212_15610, partial [Bacteroidales bacterium]